MAKLDWLYRRLALLVCALVLLPIMAVAAAWGYAVLGALPAVRFTGEQIEALSWLPVITCYAGAAIVVAAFFNNAFTWEPGKAVERAWHEAALAGDRNARWLLVRNDLRWAVLLVLSGAFFWMAR
jgi:hypothetical protein